jgi:hypothetical protein
VPADRDVDLPPHLAAGAYASEARAWHARHELVIDFLVRTEADEPRRREVVSRVRLPYDTAFEMLQRVSATMIEHERDRPADD